MCDTCGCGENDHQFTMISENMEQHHDHGDHGDAQAHSHGHSHGHSQEKQIRVETDILSKNNLLAERNRGYFEAKNIFVINFVSSPGSGKTTLLERLIDKTKSKKSLFVIEGDQQTDYDAKRIKAAGASSLQINTGNGCHLDAHMINHAVNELKPAEHSLLFIENVGNLVCPALFDLGERLRIVVASTTEGEDKPLKYPTMFQSAQICVLNKIDLIPHLDFNEEIFYDNLKMVNPDIHLVPLSAKTGEGIDALVSMILE